MTSVYGVGFEVERFQSLLFDVEEEEFAVQAFNATAVIAAMRGIPLAVSDERFQNSVMYAALVLNAVLLLIGLRIASRLRPRFARPS